MKVKDVLCGALDGTGCLKNIGDVIVGDVEETIIRWGVSYSVRRVKKPFFCKHCGRLAEKVYTSTRPGRIQIPGDPEEV